MGKIEKAPATLKSTQKNRGREGAVNWRLKCKCISELAQEGKGIFPKLEKSAKDTLIDVNFLIPTFQNPEENKAMKIRNCYCACSVTQQKKKLKEPVRALELSRHLQE